MEPGCTVDGWQRQEVVKFLVDLLELVLDLDQVALVSDQPSDNLVGEMRSLKELVHGHARESNRT